jgi:hypothetical protein
LTAEQIAEARSLAFNTETKKWENWQRITQATKIVRDQDDEVLADEETERFYNRPTIVPAESEIYG